ncbi:MAG: Uma2 family endonuclease, partial [Chloroflexota bacterium]|nr:Uma2 family endonuclease [Chloroflexota bacterium]
MATTQPAGRRWTYEELLRLPDDGRRYEILDGELYELPTPTPEHAAVLMRLTVALHPAVTALGARMFTAPLDVLLSDEAQPVQPDLLVLLPDHLDRIGERAILGPPDLVVEVLSSSNAGHARITKRD